MRIAVLIDDLFEDAEYVDPARAFRDAGHTLVHIGLKRGATVKGKQCKAEVRIDEAASDAFVDDYGALFIPGGYSPDRLRGDERAVALARSFMKSGKPVFSICHAPQLLITADSLRGRTLTGWKSIVQDIKNAGATFVDQEVVEDGNLISSRSPHDIPAFCKACLAKLKAM